MNYNRGGGGYVPTNVERRKPTPLYVIAVLVYVFMKYLYWLHDHIISCHASHKVKLGELHEAREPRKDMSNTGQDPEYKTTVFSDVDVEKNLFSGQYDTFLQHRQCFSFRFSIFMSVLVGFSNCAFVSFNIIYFKHLKLSSLFICLILARKHIN